MSGWALMTTTTTGGEQSFQATAGDLSCGRNKLWAYWTTARLSCCAMPFSCRLLLLLSSNTAGVCTCVCLCVSEQSTRVKIWSKLAGLILTLGHHWIASAEFVSHKWLKRATRTNHSRDWIKERWELFMNKASKLANHAGQRKKRSIVRL